jgi:hypothetical protein
MVGRNGEKGWGQKWPQLPERRPELPSFTHIPLLCLIVLLSADLASLPERISLPIASSDRMRSTGRLVLKAASAQARLLGEASQQLRWFSAAPLAATQQHVGREGTGALPHASLALTARTHARTQATVKLLIDGQMVESQTKQWLPVLNPVRRR